MAYHAFPMPLNPSQPRQFYTRELPTEQALRLTWGVAIDTPVSDDLRNTCGWIVTGSSRTPTLPLPDPFPRNRMWRSSGV